jgi:predicted ATPase
MGGSGKTCLALRAAEHYASTTALLDEHPFADGIYRVRLIGGRARGSRGSDAPPQFARRLAIAIGRALGMDVCAAIDPAAQVLAWLQPRKVLLVVENGEHLQAGLAVLRAVVQQAPGVKLLVTSRERLQVPGEWVTELGGLALPRDASQVDQAAASQLFLQQSQQVGMDGELTADDRDHIVQICRLTEGLPLALILAARWRRGLSCAEIAAALAQGIDVLATTDGGIPERHRSMRAMLDTSWERLTPDMQAALGRLSVCENGFALEAAHATAGAKLAQLLALRDCSLLSYDEHGRYVLHELVRRYAAEKLASQPEEERDVRALHAAYYSSFVKKHADALRRTQQARDIIGREIANVRTAWAWAVTHGDIHLLRDMRQGLVAWYELTGEYGEWSQSMGWAAGEVRKALSAADSTDAQNLLCALLVDKARGWIGQGHYDRARASLQEATARAQAGQSPQTEAYAACYLGQLLYRQGLTEAAQQQLERALALAQAAGAQDLEARSLWYLGRVAVAMAKPPKAHDYCVQALSLYRALGDQLGEAAAICSLLVDWARGWIEQGQYDRAQVSLWQATLLAQTSQSQCPEADVAPVACLQAASGQEDRELGLYDPGRPQLANFGGGSDQGVAGQLAHPAFGEIELAAEVENIERLARGEVSGLIAALRHTLAAGLGLDGRRPIEDGLIGDLLLACLVEQGLTQMAQAELGPQEGALQGEGARHARRSKAKGSPYFVMPRWVTTDALRWWARAWRRQRIAASGST